MKRLSLELPTPQINVLLVAGDAEQIELPLVDLRGGIFRVYRSTTMDQAVHDVAAIDPDVVLLNLNLPDYSGIQSFHEFYKHYPMIPVVVLTSDSDRHLGVEAIRLGAQDNLLMSETNSRLMEKVIFFAVERNRIFRQLSLENELNRRLSIDLEDKVRRRTQELADAKAIAEHNLQIKGHFLNNITHEIRTPMTCIMGALSLLKNSDFPKKYEPHLEMISENSQRIFHFFESILDFSKIQSEELQVKNAPFRMENLVAHLSRYVDQYLSKKDVKYDAHCECFDTLSGDFDLLTKSLQALLSNAIRYTNAGTITMVVRCDRRESSHWVVFEIGNTGIPIEPDLEAILFEPFAQVHGTKTAKYQGAGVGLSIARGIVKKMAGSISFRRDPARGNLFSIELPLPKYDLISRG